ncbi:4a-hydroxytetrahydrobiopterin dehydratase [Streptomyces sp. 110]|uniref:Putative pterin-4-alpha-carbinolamine dehydratase n=1 Tax=Streptomyces endocoffeicus TaxID=2898945 RepID=A0ABS1Q853_9ACTN|nr:4a-hydroxytetrahydrobiopterin dehydratase [Streptomyces endocoffeicus]MBL1120525.1 4a-hydroxytetrahydrobiopterin dehydratase [Streptomyces endocoffeicus]
MAERDPLAAEEVQAHLERWEGWSGDTSRIGKTYQLDYYTSIKVINEVAEAAQKLQHHPDIDIRWERLHFSITTYSAGAVITPLDFKLVAEIERVAAAHGAKTAP